MFKVKFLRNILLVSLAMAILLPSYNTFIAYPSFINALTKIFSEEAIHTATHLMSMLIPEDIDLTEDSLSVNPQNIEKIKKNLSLEKIKIFLPSGKVIYSTDPEDIGTINKNKYFHEIVAKGGSYTKLVEKDLESLEGQFFSVDVIEAYVPIEKGGKFLGAFEIYYNITKIKDQYKMLALRSSVLLFMLASGLVFIVIAISVKASKSISERERMEKKLYTLSITDELTGISNRRGFFTLAKQQFKIANRTKRKMLLFLVDLDGLKSINDILGHNEGDQALIGTADILKKSFRESDIVARIGGDEFAVLAMETIEVTAVRLNSNLDAYNSKSNKSYNLSLSTGMVRYDPEHPSSIDEMFSRADKLLYEQKKKKKKKNI